MEEKILLIGGSFVIFLSGFIGSGVYIRLGRGLLRLGVTYLLDQLRIGLLM